MDNEEQALSRVRTGLILGSWLVGLAAGFIAAWYGEGELNFILVVLIGLISVVLGGMLGGFIGVAVRMVYRKFSKLPDESEFVQEDDVMGGLGLGTFFGAFLGLVIMLVAGYWDKAHVGAAVGAAILSFIAAVYNDLFSIFVRMLAMEHMEPAKPSLEELKDEWRKRPAAEMDDAGSARPSKTKQKPRKKA